MAKVSISNINLTIYSNKVELIMKQSRELNSN